jgi:hypothetical protein
LQAKLKNPTEFDFYQFFYTHATISSFENFHKDQERQKIQLLEENERKRERTLKLHGLLGHLPSESGEINRKISRKNLF